MGPFLKERLNEALRLPIVLGSIGPRHAVLDAELGENLVEGTRHAIGAILLGHQTLHRHATASRK